MALEGLQIVDYRALSGVDFEGLGRVSLFVGGNNSGKSSLLEAAGLVLRPFDPGQWVQTATHRDASPHIASGLWSMFPRTSALHVDDTGVQTAQPLRLAATVHGVRRTLEVGGSARAELITGEHGDEWLDAVVELDARLQEGEAEVKSHPMVFGWNKHTRSSRSTERVFTVTPATHRSTRQLLRSFSRALDADRKELALRLLRLFDPQVEDVFISEAYGAEHLRVKHEARGVADLSSFGDGMRRSVAIALAFALAESGVVLIDEIEGGIHPRALKDVITHLLQAAVATDVQLLATTHSLEAIDAVLDAVNAVAITDVVGYHIRRAGQGHQVRRYGQEKLLLLREGGLDLR